jgi:actin-related protein
MSDNTPYITSSVLALLISNYSGKLSAYNLDVRKDLCKNIILSRGSTMYESLAERLKNEITNLAAGGA